MPATRQIRRAMAASFLLYVVFGLPDDVFGTVWPNQRDHFDRTDGSLGLLVVATSIGYADSVTPSMPRQGPTAATASRSGRTCHPWCSMTTKPSL